MQRFFTATIVAFALGGLGADWYVSPNVLRYGKGSRESPWNLATGLAYKSMVKPGDTLYLLGGTYRGTFKPILQGTPDRPITIRSAPGEWAVIDGSLAGQATKNVTAIEIVQGGWLVLRDFEITNSDPEREIKITGSNPPERRGGGISVGAPGIVLDGLVIHDCGDGIGMWSSATQSTVRNSIVYNIGWRAPDRGHGHGLYVQSTDERFITGNLFGPGFSGYSIHAYGSSRARLDHLRVTENVCLHGALFGGSATLNDAHISANLFWNTASFGYTTGLGSGTRIAGNRFAGPWYVANQDASLAVHANLSYALHAGPPLTIATAKQPDVHPSQYAFRGNTYYKRSDGDPRFGAWDGHAWVKDFADWQTAYGQDGDGTYHDRVPDERDDEVLALGTAENRRLVAVLNFSSEPAVAVDLPWFKAGDRYRIRHALNYHAVAVEGEYTGGTVSLPMGRPESIAVPVGWKERLMEPDLRFGCFVVERI